MSSALVLTKDVEKMLKANGLNSATIVTLKDKAKVDGKVSKLDTFVKTSEENLAAMNKEMKALVASIPDQVFYGSIGTAIGVLLATKGYAYAVEYFGVDSYAPDVLLPVAGFAVAWGGTTLKDPPKKPGLNAPARSFSIGLGAGLVAGSAWCSYDRRIAMAA